MFIDDKMFALYNEKDQNAFNNIMFGGIDHAVVEWILHDANKEELEEIYTLLVQELKK